MSPFGKRNHKTNQPLNPPNLPLLAAVVQRTWVKKETFTRTAIIYIHHALKTSVNLIDALIELGAIPKHVFILGKSYSECPEVVNELKNRGVYYQSCSKQNGIGQYVQSFTRDVNWLWSFVLENLPDTIENILILDHGGYAIEYLPLSLLSRYQVIAIEKTTAGFVDTPKHHWPPVPLIDVANSMVKRGLESPMIAEVLIKKLGQQLPKLESKSVLGVIGLGAIGKALTHQLLDLGYQLVVSDVNACQWQAFANHPNVICTDNCSALIAAADFIFGCSGRDVAEGNLEQFILARQDKYLISCSSGDIEYLSLLKHMSRCCDLMDNPFNDLIFMSEYGAKIHILRGGFPYNFDHSGESVPAHQIQITRALVLSAVIQAVDFFETGVSANQVYKLDDTLQRFVMQEWMRLQNQLNADIHPSPLLI